MIEKMQLNNNLKKLLDQYAEEKSFKPLEVLMHVHLPMFKSIFKFLKTNKIAEEDLVYSGILADIVSNTAFVDTYTVFFCEFEDMELVTEFYLLLEKTIISVLEGKDFSPVYFDSILLINICTWVSSKIKERLYEVGLEDIDFYDDTLCKQLDVEGL